VQATLVREIHKGLHHKKGYRIPSLKDFMYRPPVPLFDVRERAKAEKRAKAAKGKKK
jgi:hypothetical protein